MNFRIKCLVSFIILLCFIFYTFIGCTERVFIGTEEVPIEESSYYRATMISKPTTISPLTVFKFESITKYQVKTVTKYKEENRGPGAPFIFGLGILGGILAKDIGIIIGMILGAGIGYALTPKDRIVEEESDEYENKEGDPIPLHNTVITTTAGLRTKKITTDTKGRIVVNMTKDFCLQPSNYASTNFKFSSELWNGEININIKGWSSSSDLPEIEIVSPTANPYVTPIRNLHIVSNIKNIKAAKDVKLKIDGQEIKAISVEKTGAIGNFNEYTFSWDVNLIEGYNEFELIALSGCDEVSEILTINYQQPIAVLDLNAINIPHGEALALTERLQYELFNTGNWLVLERSKVDAMIAEVYYQQGGCITDECAVEIGRQLNVRRIIAGSISKVGNIFTITIRLIDVETSKILLVEKEDMRGTLEDVLLTGIKNLVLKLTKRKW